MIGVQGIDANAPMAVMAFSETFERLLLGASSPESYVSGERVRRCSGSIKTSSLGTRSRT